MEINQQQSLDGQIRELLNSTIDTFNTNGEDSVTMKTMKLHTVGIVLEKLRLGGWNFVLKLFKTHTPVHPKIAQELLKYGDDEMACTLCQGFVRNDKLVRIVKQLAQHEELNMDKILGVDGLAGNISNGPNFEYKHYIGNLRFANKGEPKSNFDEESEFKRLHVQTVREMYDMMGNTPSPTKHIYDILRKCFYQTVGANLPEIEFEEKEAMDGELEGKIAIMYMNNMGRENMQSLVKSLRFRGEKRLATESETSEEENGTDKKKLKSRVEKKVANKACVIKMETKVDETVSDNCSVYNVNV